jgi:DnaJ-domain-containing protein 1
MKPKAYAEKYSSLTWTKETELNFQQDFLVDFQTILELALGKNQQLSLSAFASIERQMTEKFKSIGFKIPQLPQNIWGLFITQVLEPTKKQVCAQEIKREQRKAQRKNQFETAMHNLGNQMREQTIEDFFSFLLRAQKFCSPIPHAAFSRLGLNPTKETEAIKTAYRTAAKNYHPDTGGDAQLFAQITEDKNQCLAYANS